jgi:predicted acylesterase/phospholipase RssA
MALGAAASAAAAPGAALAQEPATAAAPAPERGALERALVLSGGGALGAYEAGIVAALVRAAGVREGEPLRPYGAVCGTSIGALNAYFVATAQYERLSLLWSSISAQDVIRLKPQYAKIVEPSSGIGSRLWQQIALLTGLRHDVMGVLDGERLRAWLLDYMDVQRPIVMPMFWAVTNLTFERPEYFYLLPDGASPDAIKLALASARLALGPDVPVRPASRELLIDQLRASAAVPVAFDPVSLPAPGGGTALYVDGGVTANTPIRIASAIALRIDAVLLNPAFQADRVTNAVQVAAGSFDTMQRRLMENALRSAYVESFTLRALQHLPDSFIQQAAAATGVSVDHLLAVQRALYQTDLWVVRPQKALPVSIFGFSDEDALAATYDMGEADGTAGFSRFDPITRTTQATS